MHMHDETEPPDCGKPGEPDDIDASSIIKVTPAAVRSVILGIIDDKRRHMERKIFTVQRDALLLDELIEDKLFRKEISETHSTESFTGAFIGISQSMVQ